MAFSAVILVWSNRTSYSASRDSMGNTMKTASGNYCKTFMGIQRSDQMLCPFSTVFRSRATRPPIHRVGIAWVIQWKRPPETTVKLSWRSTVGSKVMAFFNYIPVWSDKTSYSSSRDSMGNTRKTAYGNDCKTFMAIQRSDQKLWPFSIVIPVWSDKTSYSSSRDSIGNTRKTASGNYCKTFMAIQQSNQKLWPFLTVIPVWNDKTSYSSSRDSIGNTRKTASGN